MFFCQTEVMFGHLTEEVRTAVAKSIKKIDCRYVRLWFYLRISVVCIIYTEWIERKLYSLFRPFYEGDTTYLWFHDDPNGLCRWMQWTINKTTFAYIYIFFFCNWFFLLFFCLIIWFYFMYLNNEMKLFDFMSNLYTFFFV